VRRPRTVTQVAGENPSSNLLTPPRAWHTHRFEGGVRAVEIPPEGKLVLTTDPAWAEKGTAEKVNKDAVACLR
jgi:hypothetical protein